MSADGRPDWRAWLVGAAGGFAAGMFTNLLSDELPPIVGWAVGIVAAAAYWVPRLKPRAGFVEALLYVTAGGIALMLAVPVSWAGPMTAGAVVLAVCAALGARDRKAALTSLAGIGVFAAGLVMISQGIHIRIVFGRVLVVVLGGYAALGGLLCLRFRRTVFGPRGVSMDRLRGPSPVWPRIGTVGVLMIPLGVQEINTGHPLVAILLMLAGVPWFVLATTFFFSTGGDVLIGAMLAVSGAALTGLGLVGFYDQEFLGGIVAVTLGVAMTGGGLSLLHGTGALRRLRESLFET